MSEHDHHPHGESICIRTDKVYDWCFKNGTNTFAITDLIFPPHRELIAGVECAIVDDPELTNCQAIGRTQAGGGIAIVTLQKTVTFDITFVDVHGNVLPAFQDSTPLPSQRRSRIFQEFIQVCAPTGTDVLCELMNAGCRATITGTNTVSVDIFLCQSIESVAPVKVCVDIVDFCVPDVCDPPPQPFLCPPLEFNPPQCHPGDPRFTPPCPPHVG